MLLLLRLVPVQLRLLQIYERHHLLHCEALAPCTQLEHEQWHHIMHIDLSLTGVRLVYIFVPHLVIVPPAYLSGDGNPWLDQLT